MKATLKRLCLCACLALLASTAAFAQKKTFSDVLEVELQNSGTILDGDQNITGYFMFYKADKTGRKTNDFILTILDQNLNEMSEKKIAGKEELQLLSAHYNGSNLLLGFYESSSKMINNTDRKGFYKQYDKEGKLVPTSQVNFVPVSEREGFKGALGTKKDLTIISDFVLPLQNKGFLVLGSQAYSRFMYDKIDPIRLIPQTDVQGWIYKPTTPSKMQVVSSVFLARNDSILLLDATKHTKEGQDVQRLPLINGLNINTGKPLFESELKVSGYYAYPMRALYDKESKSFVIYGLFSDQPSAHNLVSYMPKPHKSLGLCFLSINPKGEITNQKFELWKDGYAKYFELDDDGMIRKKGSPDFSELLKTSDGRYFIIGYQDRGGNNLVVLEYSPTFELKDAKFFEKDNNLAFSFLQTANDQFSVGYVGRPNPSAKSQSRVFDVTTYIDGEFVSDKTEVKSDATSMRIFPAKPGYIMVMEYFKKEKKLETRLEKINF